MRRVFNLLGWNFLMLLFISSTVMLSQENQKEQEKKNPESQNLEIGIPQQDTSNTNVKAVQRQYPKFDLPEYIITGLESEDLPKVEKVSFEDFENLVQTKRKSFVNQKRERETMELEVRRLDDSQVELKKYSGMMQGGIGTYFTPRAELWFGQSLSNFQYTLNGTYHHTNGFAKNTDQSEGSVGAAGRINLLSNAPIIQNSGMNGEIGYSSKSFHFYGSTIPDLQRTISDVQLDLGIENRTANKFPYLARISFENIGVSDSSVSIYENRFDLNLQTSLPIASIPFQMKFHGMTASSRLGFIDVSGGIQNYWYAGILLEGSLHIYWAKGMAGQDLFRLNPHLTLRYPITSQHCAFVSYTPMIIPKTLASNIRVNQFLSTVSSIRHTDVRAKGELGIESDWNETVRSRLSLGIEAISDLTMFSDFASKGVWMTAYSGDVTFITLRAEMVAKFKSNDYFASTIMLRSIKDSFLGKHIPYFPLIEAGCCASHRFKTAIVVSANVRLVGEQQADLIGSSTVSGYTVIDVSSEYTPLDFLRFSIGIKNLTDTRYETWRGYQEFPVTLFVAVQLKW